MPDLRTETLLELLDCAETAADPAPILAAIEALLGETAEQETLAAA